VRDPVICFGQQPCGSSTSASWFQNRDGQALQQEIGGEIVYFFHDSDHDLSRDPNRAPPPQDRRAVRVQLSFENQTQRKYSPLY